MMNNQLYRASRSDISADGRNLTGLALRWNKASKVTDNGTDFYLESFASGSADKTLKERGAIPNPLGVWHPWASGPSEQYDEPIGMVRFSTSNEGLVFDARMFKGEQPDAILGKVRAREMEDVSVGFVPYQSADIDGVTVRQEVALYELSLAPTGTAQHADARVLSIRARTAPSRLKYLRQRAALHLWLPDN